ncbi:hypothetical protein [Salibacterium aidingense]|uniref:hypothetical protein n=1 Tax=Salibacterium aidingense TaxID=384933 RepID=UPI000424DD31|nr:hypothetical protein [Salibacterium aidingense]
MAFGINRRELNEWKRKVNNGEIAFITHYWYDPRFPDCRCVTKAGCADVNTLSAWGKQYGLKPEWIHERRTFPHFDLLGATQVRILKEEGIVAQLERFILPYSDEV